MALKLIGKLRALVREKVRTSAIILAGGSSTRMGGVSKQFMEIDGTPILAITLTAFEKCRNVDDIVIVAKRGEENDCIELCRKYKISKLKKVVTGGSTRQESAYRGLEAVDRKSKFIAIHDGARPFIDPMTITDVINAAKKSGCAIAAVKSKDTVKISTEDMSVESTPDRKNVFIAQTPQVFYKTIYEAIASFALRDNFVATDDSSLAEHYGHKVTLVESSYDNIKITDKSDIPIAEAIYSMKKKENK